MLASNSDWNRLVMTRSRNCSSLWPTIKTEDCSRGGHHDLRFRGWPSLVGSVPVALGCFMTRLWPQGLASEQRVPTGLQDDGRNSLQIC